MAFTQEQLQALLGMGDITGQEDEFERQLAQAEQMRNAMANVGKRNDWGSNLGRAGYGIAGAMQDYQADKKLPQISKSRQEILAKLFRNKFEGGNVDPAKVDDWMQ
jgi:hypothetical protein